MRVFILLHKDQDDYSSLGGVDKVFVFDRMGAPSDEATKQAMTKLDIMFDSVSPDDKIIFNGPSWLIAIAGYMWLSRDDRKTMNILAYENFKKQYIEINNEY